MSVFDDNHRPVSLARTLGIRGGIALVIIASTYLLGGLAGFFPLQIEALAWNNIRIVAGAAILGCLMAAVGYGDN